MASTLDGIDSSLAAWLMEQPVFFVATAPRSDDQLINCSPKGLAGTFTVVDEHTVAYLDLTGSGIETIAHLRENGRIVLMFCAFDGRPRIIRMHGRGRVVLPHDDAFAGLRRRFSDHPGVRSVIVVDVTRVSDSCGYGVPTMAYVEDRAVLDLSAEKRGEEGLVAYRRDRNATSLDGLPGLPLP
jgi:Pyridoxamine 5'-phosphate oxidase